MERFAAREMSVVKLRAQLLDRRAAHSYRCSARGRETAKRNGYGSCGSEQPIVKKRLLNTRLHFAAAAARRREREGESVCSATIIEWIRPREITLTIDPRRLIAIALRLNGTEGDRS